MYRLIIEIRSLSAGDSQVSRSKKDPKQTTITKFLTPKFCSLTNCDEPNENIATITTSREPQRETLVQRNLFPNEDIDVSNFKPTHTIVSQDDGCDVADDNKENVDISLENNISQQIKEEEKHIHIEDDPLPLKNLGNTCYMNSIIQSLFVLDCFMSELTDYYETSHDSMTFDAVNMTNALICLYSEYIKQKKLTSAMETEIVVKHLSQLKSCVGEKNSQFKSFMQQDAAEFLDLILNSLKEEFIKNIAIASENPIQKFFEIEFDSILRCCKCETDSQLPSVTNSALYLSIPENTDNFTLQDALRNYLNEERTEHKCNTEDCDSNEKYRYTTIKKLPVVLFVQLGRYSDNGEKRHEIVEIPEKLYFPKLNYHDERLY
ncbi:hypothetical protein B4U80_12724 [Leptotrombidium deliense]|uniref:USP domain-containing protein n=1 Tax=Leptotrombidium deliense TaxID=299467 RepID=A0A443SW69_9ACAR|nr:hypothetical protein B4U80_12724 [Leptotrombidium deliense]